MDGPDKTMMKNIEEKFGKPFEEWIKIVKKSKLEKHSEILNLLKKKYGFTHGYANLVSMKARAADAGSVDDKSQLVDDQYKGKEELRPIYNKILKEINKFGNDIEIAPKKASVSLRRKRQFALIQPTTKTRVDLGLKLKDVPVKGRLESSGPFGTMCTHRIKLTSADEIDKEVLMWLKESYQKAG